MTTGITTTTDFRGLAELRARAASGESTETAREAARQFEALFVQMMLKGMRDATAALGEDRDRTYEEMFDQQIALEMTRGQGIGLADLLVQQLRLGAGAPAAVAPDGAVAPVAAPAAAGSGADFRPGSPAEFVRALWPHAEQAGRELGIDPRAIVAQAALETGWGERQIRDGDGRSSFNLFGIKADERWPGRRVGVTTLEYTDGIALPQRAQFRAYGSLAEGVADYARFLRTNPRYRAALAAGGDSAGFAAGLQSAGYATDPAYAAKLGGILASPLLNGAVAALKDGAGLPIQPGNRS